jgi:hypothetical protein
MPDHPESVDETERRHASDGDRRSSAFAVAARLIRQAISLRKRARYLAGQLAQRLDQFAQRLDEVVAVLERLSTRDPARDYEFQEAARKARELAEHQRRTHERWTVLADEERPGAQ